MDGIEKKKKKLEKKIEKIENIMRSDFLDVWGQGLSRKIGSISKVNKTNELQEKKKLKNILKMSIRIEKKLSQSYGFFLSINLSKLIIS